MLRTAVIIAVTVLAALAGGKLLAPAGASSTAIATPDTHSWLWQGQASVGNVAITAATVTVPAGKCLRVDHVDIDAEKSGGTLPYGGEFTVSLSPVLPSGDETGGGTELAGASTPSDTRLEYKSLDYAHVILPPGTVVKVIVYLGGAFQAPPSNYYWFVTLLGDYIGCV